MCNENVASTVVSSNYSNACEQVPPSNEDLLKITNPEGCIIHGSTLFALKYRTLPCILKRKPHKILGDCNNIRNFSQGGQRFGQHKKPGIYHATSVLRFLIDEYKVDPSTFLYKRSYDTQHKSYLMSVVYIDLGNQLSVLFDDGLISFVTMNNPNALKPDHQEQIFHCFNDVEIFHVPQTTERADTLLQQLSQFELYEVTEAALQMVCHSANWGFYTTSIRMKKPDIIDLKLHYGDQFSDIHEELLEILQEKNSSGITMFHGPPGTGKTNYLRYLINEIQNKELIYVPPDLVNDISNPNFLPFLMKHPNSILIIEDAENIIHERTEAAFLPKQAVSNLLNLSDGLLGDAMHQQIICTFNCDVQSIDPALLREGRLVIEHKFDKLSVEDSRRLYEKLGISDHSDDIQEPTTLAELYARKNALQGSSTNNLKNDPTTMKSKRLLRNKKQQSNTFLGLYS